MKFVASMFVAFSFQNAAFAQPAPTTASPGDLSQSASSLASQAEAACNTAGDLSQCCSQYGTCTQNLVEAAATCTAQINDALQTCGYRDQSAACRARHGVIQNNECVCEAGRQWNDPVTKACCVTNPARYERNRQRCENSGGTYRCSQRGDGGWCSCPLGMDHPLDEDGDVDLGVCAGETVNRQRIQEMRNDLASLAAERDRLAARARELEEQLRIAESEGDELQDELEATRQELAAVRRYLDFLRDILASHGIEAPSEDEVAGATPHPAEGGVITSPGEIPGAREAAAQVAAESTQVPPGPEQTGSSSPEEESWCEENPVPCGFIIAGAIITAAGLGVGLYEAFKPPPEVEIGFDYHR